MFWQYLKEGDFCETVAVSRMWDKIQTYGNTYCSTVTGEATSGFRSWWQYQVEKQQVEKRRKDGQTTSHHEEVILETPMASRTNYRNLQFPLVEQFFFKRIVFDEFHETLRSRTGG